MAEAAGLSVAQISRVERGLVPGVPVLVLARLSAVLGLELSVRTYPTGEPIRDAAQVLLVQDFRGWLHPVLAWRLEAGMPIAGDLRAWDGLVSGHGWRYGVDAETAPRDAQALVRRLEGKARDSGVDGVLLVLRDTVQSRRFLAAAGEYLAPMFPVAGKVALRALADGRDPGGSAIIVLPRHRAGHPRR